jgi:hypothetical protein
LGGAGHGWVGLGRRVHFTGRERAMLIGWGGEPFREQRRNGIL